MAEGSADVAQFTMGLRVVQTTYLLRKQSMLAGRQLKYTAPSVPDTFRLFDPWCILLECVYFIADLQRHDISMNVMVFGCGRCCSDDGKPIVVVTARPACVATRGRQRVHRVAVYDKW